MEDLRRHEDAQVFAVDEDGRDLLGRAVPADALARARESLRADVESQRARRVQLTGSGAWLIFIPIESAPFWKQCSSGPARRRPCCRWPSARSPA